MDEAIDVNESNRRAARRRRTLKSALAMFDDDANGVTCIVRDISETGAKLLFENPVIVPRTFLLRVDLDDYEVECERVWQKHLTCGVRFISGHMPVVAGRDRG